MSVLLPEERVSPGAVKVKTAPLIGAPVSLSTTVPFIWKWAGGKALTLIMLMRNITKVKNKMKVFFI